MLNTIEEAIKDLKKGKCIIVVDDDNRENEGDFVALAEYGTPELVNFMITIGRGLLCAPITQQRADELHLELMVNNNTDPNNTAFTVSLDYSECDTGISAVDRAQTIRKLADSKMKSFNFRKPGHIFPLIEQKGGVFARRGHTEATIDLARIAKASPAGFICEIIKKDGNMARMPDLQSIANQFDLKIISVKSIFEYRIRNEQIIKKEIEVNLPTKYGDFKMIGYSNKIDDHLNVALIKGNLTSSQKILVRIHSECFTGDIFDSRRCDCGSQLECALKLIERENLGVLIYLKQEGRGIGLLHKLKAYKLQEGGYNTVEANLQLGFPPDLREYHVAIKILKALGVRKIKLLTNNPAKLSSLLDHFSYIERIPLEIPPTITNYKYLKTKFEKMGHMLHHFKF